MELKATVSYEAVERTEKRPWPFRPVKIEITPDMWVEVEGEKYDILYILDPYLKHVWLELFCEVRFHG